MARAVDGRWGGGARSATLCAYSFPGLLPGLLAGLLAISCTGLKGNGAPESGPRDGGADGDGGGEHPIGGSGGAGGKAGTGASGNGSGGSTAAGSGAGGSDQAGSGTAGTDAAGSDAAGSDAAGSDAAGSDAAGTDGTAGSSEPNAAPVLTIDFPVPGLTEQATITVRGRVADGDGDAIASLTVAGVTASVEADGQWSAVAPLALGDNALEVIAVDERGAEGRASAPMVTRSGYLFGIASAFALDAATRRVFAADAVDDAVVEIELATGERSVISAGQLPARSVRDIALDAAGGRLLVAETDAASLAWIAIANGARTELLHVDSTPAFKPSRIALDLTGGRVFVLDTDAPGLYSVALATGVRSTIPITAPNLSGAADLAYDATGARLLLVRNSGAPVVAVNPSSGATTVISDAGHGAGEALRYPNAIDLDPAGGRALIYDEYDTSGFVFEVDLASGDRRKLAGAVIGSDPGPGPSSSVPAFAFAPGSGGSPDTALVLGSVGRLVELQLDPGKRSTFSSSLYGSGPTLDGLQGLALDAVRDRVLAIPDGNRNELLGVDLATGDRKVVSGPSVGDGILISQPMAATMDGDRILLAETQRLIAIDPVSGDRTLVSDASKGTGTVWVFPGGIAVDRNNNRALLGNIIELYAVDLANGNRTVLSSSTVGTGPSLSFGRVLVDDMGRYLALDDTSIISVDPSNGNRTVLISQTMGTGPDFVELRDFAMDPDTGRLLVLDYGLGALLSVDLTTGDRFVVSTDGAAAAPAGMGYSFVYDLSRQRALMAMSKQVDSIDIVDHTRTLLSDQQRGAYPPTSSRNVLLDPGGTLAYQAVYYTFNGGNVYGIQLASVDLATGTLALLPIPTQTNTFSTPLSLALDPAGGRAFGLQHQCLIGCTPPLAVTIDLSTGEQAVIASTRNGALVGDGPLDTPNDIAWDGAHDRLLFSDSALDALIAIDPVSLSRTVVSGGPTGTGDALVDPFFLALDSAHDRVLAYDSAGIRSVELGNGNRTLLSAKDAAAAPGSGPSLGSPLGLVSDPTHDRLIEYESAAPALLAIDLTTGARSQLCALPSFWSITGSAFLFVGAHGFDYDAAHEIGYLNRFTGLAAIDTRTGEYVIVSGSTK